VVCIWKDDSQVHTSLITMEHDGIHVVFICFCPREITMEKFSMEISWKDFDGMFPW